METRILDREMRERLKEAWGIPYPPDQAETGDVAAYRELCDTCDHWQQRAEQAESDVAKLAAPPQVPEEVVEAAARLRKDMYYWVASIARGHVKTVLDHFIPEVAPPEVPLALPRRFRGKFKGKPVVGIQWDEHRQDIFDGTQQPGRAYDVKDSLEITEWIDGATP